MKLAITAKPAPNLAANLQRYSAQALARVRQVVPISMERAYQLGQSLVPVASGETKSKMRKELNEDGLGYQMGFFRKDFGAPVPWWLEFGTRKMTARPTIMPVREAEWPRFKADVAQAVEG